MKIIRSLFSLLILAAFCAGNTFAGVPGKTELSMGGTFTNFKEGGHAWAAAIESLFPVTDSGILLLGPAVAVSSADEDTRFGATLEFNIPGGQKGGLFAGGTWQYFVKDSGDLGLDQTTTALRAGLKLPIADSGLIKLFVEKAVSGRGHEESDLNGGLALAVKF